MSRPALAAFAAVLLVIAPVVGPAAATQSPPDSDPDALALLQAAVERARTAAFDARLLVIAFDATGPSLVELDVSQSDGDLRVSRKESWTLGRSDAAGYFHRAGELLQLGSVDTPDMGPVRMTAKYAVSQAGTRELDTGPAEPIEMVERQRGLLRERLYVDRATGLVVRRETFGDDGEPSRLAVFTQLRPRARPVSAPPASESTETRTLTPLSNESLHTLTEVGWVVPSELPVGFELRGGYALPGSEGGSVHLVYTDGLYTLSLYQQFGQLDHGSLDGAVRMTGVEAFTWPGSQPERMVWSGDGLTFTLVSDAPPDALVDVAGALPHDDAPGLPGRMVRGLGRVLDWAWPLN